MQLQKVFNDYFNMVRELCSYHVGRARFESHTFPEESLPATLQLRSTCVGNQVRVTHSKHTRAITQKNYKESHIVYHPKGPSCGCLISLSNESSKVSFSQAHLAHVGHKALANFFFVARIFRSRIGDFRRQSATIGDCRNVHERKRAKKSAPLGFHNIQLKLNIAEIVWDTHAFNSSVDYHDVPCQMQTNNNCSTLVRVGKHCVEEKENQSLVLSKFD